MDKMKTSSDDTVFIDCNNEDTEFVVEERIEFYGFKITQGDNSIE